MTQLAADGGPIQAPGHPMTPVPFKEAIEWARNRSIELPSVYYGELQGLARAMAFSIAGLAKLDQIQAVKDSLDANMAEGGTLREWQKRVRAGDIGLDLPAHRTEVIFRTNIQGNYNRGRCEQQKRHTDVFPWYMFDAINDSRTRPSHAALDGMVARHDDPRWETFTPPLGYQCRCRRIQISDKQAAHFQAADARRMQDPELAAARATAQPDKGWDYSVCSEPTEGIRRGIDRRAQGCQGQARLAADYSVWCRHSTLVKAMEDMIGALNDWNDPAKLLAGVLGQKTYARLAEESQSATQAHRLTEPQGVVLRAYTDRDLEAWPLMNQLARELPHTDPLRLSDSDIYRAGILVQIMDAALEALPAVAGVFYRGVESLGMGDLRTRFVAAHQRNVVVQWSAYTSVMQGRQEAYSGDMRMTLHIQSARDIQAFSAKQEPELVLPRDVQLKIAEMAVGQGDVPERFLIMKEQDAQSEIAVRRQFSEPYEGEAAEEMRIYNEWKAIGGKLTPEQQARAAAHLERSSVELGGPIPARFKHLQYLNKKH